MADAWRVRRKARGDDLNARITLAAFAALLLGGIAALGTPRTVTADGHEARSLDVSPEHGDCTAILVFSAAGLSPNAAVAIVRFDGLNDLIELARLESDGAGEFSIAVSDAFGDGRCSDEVFAVRLIAAPGASDPYQFGGGTVAEYRVDRPHSITLNPSGGPCSSDVTVRGQGFPPGVQVRLLDGQASPFAHDFVVLGEARTSDRGTFEKIVSPEPYDGCDDGALGRIFARVIDATERPFDLWVTADFTVGPLVVRPPAAGGAGLTSDGQRNSSRARTVWSLIATLAVAVGARRVVAKESR